MAAARDSLTIHSSWRGLVGSYAGALIVFAAGCVAVAAGGTTVFATVLFLVGLILLLGVLFDYPVASTFDARGVTRRPLLRRQLLGWDRIDRLTRSRPSVRLSARRMTPGGLVAVVGKRKYLLVDRVESPGEFDALGDLVAAATDHERLDDVLRPDTEVPPTWLYRRKRWHGDVPTDR